MKFGSVRQLFGRLKGNAIAGVVRHLDSQRQLIIQLDITNACNLNCRHCYHSNHENRGAINLDGWIKVVDQYDLLLRKLFLKPYVVLCGGEPTISPNLLPIIKECWSRWPGVGIAILSNGHSIDERVVASLRTYNPIFQISLDGPDPIKHDIVRGEGSFHSAIESVKRLLNRGFRVELQAVLSKHNACLIGDFFNLARVLGAAAMNFTRFIPQGNGKVLTDAGDDRPLAPLELRNAMSEIVAASKLFEVPSNTNQPLFNLIDESLGASGQWGFQGLIVDYKGNLKVSSRVAKTVGNVLETGLEKLFLSHPLFVALRDGKVEKCGSCKYYRRCGGNRNAAYAEFGNFLAPDPGCWLTFE